jgi:hypothetical protein
MTNDQQEVFETILSQLKASLERWYLGDPYGWLENMAEEMTYFSPFTNSRLDGRRAVEANVAPVEGQIYSPGYEVLDPHLQLGEDLAVLTYHLTELDENDALNVGWKVTDIYRQAGDKWQMIHAHLTPFAEEE